MGYGLLKEFWGYGIVTEAARAVVEQARQEGLPYLTATHDRENPGSGGVMRKLGMVYQYSYEELWQPKDIRVVFRLYQMDLDGQERSYRGFGSGIRCILWSRGWEKSRGLRCRGSRRCRDGWRLDGGCTPILQLRGCEGPFFDGPKNGPSHSPRKPQGQDKVF